MYEKKGAPDPSDLLENQRCKRGKQKAVLARERNTGATVSHDVKYCCQTYGYACRPYREMTLIVNMKRFDREEDGPRLLVTWSWKAQMRSCDSESCLVVRVFTPNNTKAGASFST